jgi:hypothetical protein
MNLNHISQKIALLRSSAEAIVKNDKLRKIMEIVLACGNYCNAGKASGSALGFKLDSLLKVRSLYAVAAGF